MASSRAGWRLLTILLLTIGESSQRAVPSPTDDVSIPFPQGLTLLGATTGICPKSLPTDPGEDSFLEPLVPLPICERADAIQCATQHLPSWINVDGTQKPYTSLKSVEVDALWQAAGTKGAALQATMRSYVSRRVSRLTELGSNQDTIFRTYYHEKTADRDVDHAYDRFYPGLNRIIAQAGVNGIDANVGFNDVEYFSNKGGDKAVVKLTASPNAGMIISLWSYADCDGNDLFNRAFSSTITWNAWKAMAGVKAGKLRYQIGHHILNVASNNIMSLAHEKYPGNVDHVPQNIDRRDYWWPVAGHGKFTPNDPAFQYLLSMPTLAVFVNMVCDVRILAFPI